MGFLKSVFEFVRSPGYSRTTAVVVLFLILAAIPLTVIISQQQQSLRQKASGSEVCAAINNIPPCDFDFQTKPCSNLGQRCIDRSNIVFNSNRDPTVVFECKEE